MVKATEYSFRAQGTEFFMEAFAQQNCGRREFDWKKKIPMDNNECIYAKITMNA